MTKKNNAKDIKENISMLDLLCRLGYRPHKKIGGEHYYFSMLREPEETPSFSVNDKSGCWYDHRLGKGGNVVDFGLLYWQGCTFPEVLEKITNETGGATVNYQRQQVVKEPSYKILAIKDLGANKAIAEYLQSRGVWLEAQGRLMEIYYYVEDEQKHRMNFFAAGWQNELGAWEVRNINFKGCLGHKAISFIPGEKKSLVVFEGFINYLSWLAENRLAANSVLVLNSLSLLQAGIEKAKSFDTVATYFDNDPSGHEATLTFKKAVPQAQDQSSVYEGYNDYNDKLVAANNSFEIGR